MKIFTQSRFIACALGVMAMFAMPLGTKAAADTYVDYAAKYGVAASDEGYLFKQEYVDHQIPELQGKTVKRVIAHMDYLYILAHDAENVPTILVYNHKDKTVLRSLECTYEITGTNLDRVFSKVGDIALTGDGYLVGVDYVYQAHYNNTTDDLVYVFRWDNDAEGLPTGDAIVLAVTDSNGNYNNAHVGYSVCFDGTMDKGTLYIPLENSSNTTGDMRIIIASVAGGKVTFKGTNGSRDNLNKISISRSAIGDYLMFGNPYETGSYIINGNKKSAFLIKGTAYGSSNDAPVKADELAAVVPVQANHTPIFKFGGKTYLAAPEYDGSDNAGVAIYDITESLASAAKVTTNTSLTAGAAGQSVVAAGSQLVYDAENAVSDVQMVLFVVRGDGLVTKFATATDKEAEFDKLYVATNWGEDNNWNPEKAVEMHRSVKGIYSVTLPVGVNTFKLGGKQGDWDTFNSDLYIVESHQTVGDCRGSKVYDLHKGYYDLGKSDCHLADAPEGQAWTLYVDLEGAKIWAELPMELYLRGSMNEWGAAKDWKFASTDGHNFTIENATVAADQEWKIGEAPAEWPRYFDNPEGEKDGYSGWERNNFGGLKALKPNRTRTMADNGDNCTLDTDVTGATLSFNLDTKEFKAAYVTEAKGAAYAYDHSYTVSEDGLSVTVTFKSTGEGTGRVVLSPKAAEIEPGTDTPAQAAVNALSFESDNMSISKGENSATFAVEDLDAGFDYNISVVYEQPENNAYGLLNSYTGGTNAIRGGVAVVKDTESPLFGRILASNGYANGLWVVDPELTEAQKFCVGDGNPFVAGTGSGITGRESTYHMTYYKGLAYVADMTNVHGGVYTWDPCDPETTPSCIFEGTFDTPKWTNADGVQVGARISTVKIVEDADGKPLMWNFWYMYGSDPGYLLAVSEFNAEGRVDSAPIKTYGSLKMDNMSVEIWPSKHNGFWEIQIRETNNNDNNCPGFAFVNNEGTMVANSSVIGAAKGSTSAIALNEDESLLFYGTSDHKIGVCDIEWDGDVPTITFCQYIEDSYNANGYWQLDFDPAGNLVAWGAGSNIKVFAIEHKARTVEHAAAADNTFTVNEDGSITSVQSVLAQEEAQSVYYNLNGQRISAERLTPGIYVRVNGTKAQKVVIR